MRTIILMAALASLTATVSLAQIPPPRPAAFGVVIDDIPWRVWAQPMNTGGFTCHTIGATNRVIHSISFITEFDSTGEVARGLRLHRPGKTPGERFRVEVRFDGSNPFILQGTQTGPDNATATMNPTESARFREALGKSDRMTVLMDQSTQDLPLTQSAALPALEGACIMGMRGAGTPVARQTPIPAPR